MFVFLIKFRLQYMSKGNNCDYLMAKSNLIFFIFISLLPFRVAPLVPTQHPPQYGLVFHFFFVKIYIC